MIVCVEGKPNTCLLERKEMNTLEVTSEIRSMAYTAIHNTDGSLVQDTVLVEIVATLIARLMEAESK